MFFSLYFYHLKKVIVCTWNQQTNQKTTARFTRCTHNLKSWYQPTVLSVVFLRFQDWAPNQDMWLPHSGQQVCMPRAFLLQHRITYLIKLSFPQWNKYIRWSGFQHSVNLLWSLNHPAWKCFSSGNLFKGLEKESRKLHIFEKQYAVFI